MHFSELGINCDSRYTGLALKESLSALLRELGK